LKAIREFRPGLITSGGPKTKKEEKEIFLLKTEAIFTIQTNQYDTASEVNFQPNGIQCCSRWLYQPSKESDIMFFTGLRQNNESRCQNRYAF